MKCSSGYYSDQGNITCSVCPPGFACPNGGIPQGCTTGEYAPERSEVCLSCPKGYKCPTPLLRSPVQCESGYYTQSERQLSCTICEAGRSCLNGNASQVCLAGTYSPSGVMNCLPCRSGNYSFEEASACLPCPAGKSCINPGQTPQNCPEGYFSNLGSGTCTICSNGYKSFENGTGCVPCDPGYYCPNPRYGKWIILKQMLEKLVIF